ncbi:hypothetical protein [Filimonas effusa]|uniref:Uncharacterized protein n=1 Tax=Filimonas effusa TaxID=2508721 RepID=A0A4Q1D0K7_9BACT|nr:hypothetical protein [Filimonas effusa]RXK81283.1 hypothetical protein ESB13_20315 [Filimonas effusa]
MIKPTFLVHATDILAAQNSTFSWSKIVKYFVAKSIEYNVDIPYTDTNISTYELPNKRTGALKNLQAFNPEQQFEILEELCNTYEGVEGVAELKIKLVTQYATLRSKSALNISAEQVNEAKGLLTKYPSAEKLYNSALEKIKNGIYDRNALDDLRLSLEEVLKKVLGNTKSLENQRPALSEFFKTKDLSPQIANLLWTTIDSYSKYQNENVKHNDNVKKTDLDVILDYTTACIKQLILHS